LFDNNTENEADFCEAYKSQILSNGVKEEKSSLNTLSKILTILLLLIIIVVVSIYGYNYITNSGSNALPPASVQVIDDDELIVTEEEPIGEMPPEVDNIVKDVAKDENKSLKKKVENTLEVPTNSQAEYLEELAQLSKEIDKERK
jgi:hypothetical protein